MEYESEPLMPAEPLPPCGHCSEPFDDHELIYWCPLCGADRHESCQSCAYEGKEAAERGECQ